MTENRGQTGMSLKGIIIIFLLSLGGCAHYKLDPWTREDTVRHGVLTAFTAIDWWQTRYIADHPEEFHEYNPCLPMHPSREQVDLYFAALWVGKTGIAFVLPKEWRKTFQYISIGASAACGYRNFELGVKFEF